MPGKLIFVETAEKNPCTKSAGVLLFNPNYIDKMKLHITQSAMP